MRLDPFFSVKAEDPNGVVKSAAVVVGKEWSDAAREAAAAARAANAGAGGAAREPSARETLNTHIGYTPEGDEARDYLHSTGEYDKGDVDELDDESAREEMARHLKGPEKGKSKRGSAAFKSIGWVDKKSASARPPGPKVIEADE